MEIVIWIGFSQSLFAAILIATKKNRFVSDKILSAWLFLLAIEFFTCGIDYITYGMPLLSSSLLLFNPAFFLYIKSLTTEKFKLKPIQLLHLVPFLLFEIIAYVVKQPYDLSNFFYPDSAFWFRLSFSIASVISWIAYNSISTVLVLQHRKKLENEFSTIESNRSLNWLIFIVVFYNLYCAFMIIIGTILVLISDINLIQYIFNYSSLLILIYILSFYGLKQDRIFRESKIDSSLPGKSKTSSLSDLRKSQIKKSLIQYIESNEAYLNPELSMNFLSEILNVPKHQLTEVLNSDIGKNFFKFINEYRVEAVKKHLSDTTNNYSIEAIGYECGFNSKSSFFTVFKKITGQTPFAYKQSLQKS